MSSALIAAPQPLTPGAPAAVGIDPGNFLADRLTVAQARALSADPATSIPMLASLAVREPIRVLANPAWELAMVAQPALLANVSDEALAALASCAKADAEFLRSAARSCALRPAAKLRRSQQCCGSDAHAIGRSGKADLLGLRTKARRDVSQQR